MDFEEDERIKFFPGLIRKSEIKEEAQWLIQWSSVPPTGDHTDTKRSKNKFFFHLWQNGPKLGCEPGGPTGYQKYAQNSHPINYEKSKFEIFQF